MTGRLTAACSIEGCGQPAMARGRCMRGRTARRISDETIAAIRLDRRSEVAAATDFGVSVGYVRDVRAGRKRRVT